MLTLEELQSCLSDAYEHLYDIAYLRMHAISRLALASGDARKDHAWQVHHALLQSLDELNPDGRAPVMSREWRKHRLMRLRYVDGLSPQEVADALAVSRRQYYRIHEEAIQSLAQILFARQPAETQPAAQSSERLETLRAEAGRHTVANDVTVLRDVLNSACALLNERLVSRRVQTRINLPDGLPALKANPKLFRQLLLGLMDYLIERAEDNALLISARSAGNEVTITLNLLQPPPSIDAHSQPSEQLNACEALASVIEVQLTPLMAQAALTGFELRAPAQLLLPAILVVDDNRDTLELYRRYLEPAGYRVLIARHFQDVQDVLAAVQPAAICLDLMLPGHDGWDILQILQGKPEARGIPIIICSVLNQRELALSLGAAGFIEKPFSGESLLTLLDGLLTRSKTA